MQWGAWCDFVAYVHGEHAVGFDGVVDLHAQQAAKLNRLGIFASPKAVPYLASDGWIFYPLLHVRMKISTSRSD
jgi:hypothetical protein